MIDQKAWEPLAMEEDPFGALATERSVTCPEEQILVEDLDGRTTWSVTTGTCNWITVSQPLEEPLYAGDRVRLELFWFSQLDNVEGLAVVGLALGDEVLVQRTVDVPTQAELLDETATLDADVPAGTPICFHVNNHGTNSWNLFDVSLAERPEPRCGEDSAP